jgi:hypothetical protein
MRGLGLAVAIGAGLTGLFVSAAWSQTPSSIHNNSENAGLLEPIGSPVDLQHYQCVRDENCGAASEKCWGSGHEWAGSTCAYCTGNTRQDVCEKSDGGTCPHTGAMQGCGVKMSGQCVGGPVGTCRWGVQVSPHCGVPRC